MAISIRDRILKKYDALSDGEKKIGKYIVDHYSEILSLSSKELAQIVGVSSTMIVRFAKEFGYQGFLPLRADLKKEFGHVRNPVRLPSELTQILNNPMASQYFNSVQEDYYRYLHRVSPARGKKMADAILQARHIFVAGIGGDSIVATYLERYLKIMGFATTLVIEEGMRMRELVAPMDASDVLMMISFPQVQSDEEWLAKHSKSIHATRFLITDSPLTAQQLSFKDFVIARSSYQTFYNPICLAIACCDLLIAQLREEMPGATGAAIDRVRDLRK